MTKYLNTQSLLWLALVLAMTGSLKHLTAVFASVDGDYLFGLIQAVAVDAGLFALAYSIRQRKVTNKPTWFVWCGVALFSLISVFGNYIYGQTALGGQLPGWVVWLKPIVLAASLPVLVIYLSEIVSDNATAVQPDNRLTKPAVQVSKPDNRLTVQPEPVKPVAVQSEAAVTVQPELTDRQRQLLSIVQDDPSVSVAELSRRLDISRTTANGDVKRLTSDGLLSKNGNGWKVKY